MKKLTCFFLAVLMSVPLSGCSSPAQTTEDSAGSYNDVASDTADSEEDTDNIRQISVRGSDGQKIVFQLNGSSAAESLYNQLPLTVQVENYSDNEKIFYPPDELDTSGTPRQKGRQACWLIMSHGKMWSCSMAAATEPRASMSSGM